MIDYDCLNVRNIVFQQKLEKTTKEIKILKYNEYGFLLKYNFNTTQLKQMLKEYKLKLSGNKKEMIERLYKFLYVTCSIIKIQKTIRGFFQRKYNVIKGDGLYNRQLCTNDIDFLSMEKLTNIPNDQFFSFKDEDGFIYGFDLLSFNNLLYKTDSLLIKNPFNQKVLSAKIINNFKKLLTLSKTLKVNIQIEMSDVIKEVSKQKSIELRSISLFHNIDSLGNYSNVKWFLSLNRLNLHKFLNELIDIWNYRANITLEIKKSICNPSGDPFMLLDNINIDVLDIDNLRIVILEILENMINKGINKDYKCLGAFYILGALTLVNSEAATTMPWLYESAYYM